MPASSDQKSAVVLCPASNSDLEDLVAIRIEAMRESLERLGRFDPNRARERFLSGFDVNSTRRIVVSGDLVGFVVIKNHLSELLLDHLYVIPRVQGLGIGSEVLTRIFREADEIGRPIKVGALKESASNRFYTRHGFVFVESGEFDNYYVRANSNAVSP
ncbi:aminoalkylphosphonate N-acetyltransferase [Pseudomonas sp. FW306-02-F02-AA]|uniref:GNAT family acetyltransferase n=1 Tax=Pseudomonas fluorescens TaxID=294 RepID=A0A0N7H073_PSEFL|nr:MULTISPECIES: GNAT family N-acetyltransferase [Pseudomonas]ALI02340.1 GNAT family acetyltransferase [Pseudomonas fluorescens]PMZ03836.1 aminoalkylphosphonate N-acetyltransferase [Pseudomonas sp. FW306-02-F02-AB]PMZ06398.1 aminoalkylphosphonate N-acetyltransferase [Pseudomonas sp. FW306-02-H06C]PMZ13684.1 aminoalkylphosphonate N-acetyltransferase [Pseudomonas sp. FW306-02-F02-AA]PMZ22775.1 aminoalkylphosphonate N-acetyltransferase [Pseudomonas sp. FW306-02-F08-AA]